MTAVLAAPPVEPVWLSIEPDPVFALLHRAVPGGEDSSAVLLVPPFGWEEMCSYRARREWASALAAAGYPCARIDLPGSGDSGGSPTDGARLEAWVRAVAAAAAWLRVSTEAVRVVALGIGLGGTLACLAAEAGAPIDDFILWGVPAKGSRLLRELRTYAGIAGGSYPEDAEADSLPDGELNLTGFRLTAETAGALERVELGAGPSLPARRSRVLLLGRGALPVDRRLQAAFEAVGAEVSAEAGADFDRLMSHPQEDDAPDDTIARSIAWLSSASGASAASAEPLVPGAAGTPARLTASQTSVAALHGGIAPVREAAFRFSGELAGSFAVLTEPATETTTPLCAVWLNGGALHHIGPNRGWVESARRWAASGVPTVRVDLPGLGESEGAGRRPLPDRALYMAERTRQTLAVVEQLAARGVGERFVVGGLCSGAYWALHAGLTDPRVAGLMLINLFTVFWSEELADERDTERSLSALQGRAWRKALRGQVTREQARTALNSLSPARLRTGRGYPVQRAQTEQVLAALDGLREQGTQALILLSRGEGLHAQLRRQGVLGRLERWPNLTVQEIPSRDHMFRAFWLQRHVHECLDRALDRVVASVGV